MRIWVTRTADEAEATAARLRQLGHAPLVGPVLAIKPMQGAAPDLKGVCALAFTSRNGVAAFASQCHEREVPVFTVGHATAQAARMAGFKTVESADGDVVALARLIARRVGALAGAVLHPGAEEPAGDLAGALHAHGVTGRAHPVYSAEPLDLPIAVVAALHADPLELDGLIVHSPRAARRLAEFEELERAAQHLSAYCISDAAAEPLRRLNFRSLAVAAAPNEASLLEALAR